MSGNEREEGEQGGVTDGRQRSISAQPNPRLLPQTWRCDSGRSGQSISGQPGPRLVLLPVSCGALLAFA
jgi:hypothetical protein